MKDRPPSWEDVNTLGRGMPCAVVVQLADGSVVAIHGRASLVEQTAQRPEPDWRGDDQWWRNPEPMTLGVRVTWDQGYRMTWSDVPPPQPVDTPAVGRAGKTSNVTDPPPRRELPPS